MDAYWFAGKVRFYSTGDGYSLRLTSNNHLTMETLGELEIAGKLVIEQGSDLKLRTHKTVGMKNCCLDSGGSIILDAHRAVEIGAGTTISKGVKLTINNLKED